MKKTSLWLCLALCLPLFATGCSDDKTLNIGDEQQDKKPDDGDKKTGNDTDNTGDDTDQKSPKVKCSKDNCSATCCDNVCRDTTENHQHCGACGNECAGDEICVDSKCQPISSSGCASGEMKCDDTCINVMRNNDNCGKCGNKCEDGTTCINGSCEIDCQNQLRCDGACYDHLNDREHCGTCNTKCADDELCINATCTTDCPDASQHVCDLKCVDIKSDPLKCGSCENQCDISERCSDGECTPTCDDETQTICDHVCSDLTQDNDHCGSCETVCGYAEMCVEGACTSECSNPDETICNHVCTTGMSDNDNCGACDNACEINSYCAEGTCVYSCENESDSICEHECVNIMSDPNNCGGCGTTCAENEVCRDGICDCPESNPYCHVTCEEGKTACGDDCFDLQNDTNHCSTCDNACGEGNLCDKGKCVDCTDKTFCDDGICYDIMNDPKNCGGCGLVCPNHVGCSEGTCSGCTGDYVDCNGDSADGCESTTADCECQNDEVKSCYYGPAGTENIGACHAGTMTCQNHKWGPCNGMVVPINDYKCHKTEKNNDLNCDGIPDGTEDYDHDGYSICDGDCCDISGQSASCTNIKNPEVIHPGVFETVGDGIDNNCNGKVDEPPKTCSASYAYGTNLTSESARNAAGVQLARAMDICDDAATDGYGLVKATVEILSNTKGNAALGTAINVFPSLGKSTPIISPKNGSAFAGISCGTFQNANLSNSASIMNGCIIPSKYHSAHGNQLQTVSGCTTGNNINDAVALKLTLKAPESATGFQFDFRFYSHEYPTYICTRYNDFFIALLESKASGIPADTNIVFDKNGSPVSVNNAFFTSCSPITCGTCKPNYTKGCVNGKCETVYGACPDGTADLAAFSSGGGATAWLTTKAPVVGGETFTLDFIIWDTGDQALDSAAIIDNFQWITSGSKVEVGTDFTDPRT